MKTNEFARRTSEGCITTSEKKSLKQFSWYDVFISYTFIFFLADRHISKIGSHLFPSCEGATIVLADG